jgi:hypothetical protein
MLESKFCTGKRVVVVLFLTLMLYSFDVLELFRCWGSEAMFVAWAPSNLLLNAKTEMAHGSGFDCSARFTANYIELKQYISIYLDPVIL